MTHKLVVSIGFVLIRTKAAVAGVLQSSSGPMPLPAPPHVTERVSTEEALQEAIALRIDVFVHEQKFPLETEVDQYDEIARTAHFVLRLLPERTVVGTIRVRLTQGGYYKIERLCVRADSRKYGFGAVLMKSAQDWVVQDAGATTDANVRKPVEAVVHAQVPVIPFYKRFGYIEEGDRFDEEGAPHQKMRAKIQDD